MVEVNTLTVFKKICELFEAEQIPFGNLVSGLSDNTNYKRVQKKWLRKVTQR